MPASEGLPLTQVSQLRTVFLDAAKSYGVDSPTVAVAVERLGHRLMTWHGSGIASAKSRFKNKVARGTEADCAVGADQAEILIVRALSLTRGECQFTVTPNGAVFASDGNGWTIDRERVFVSGLSPLIDDAADILRQMRGPNGGRMFFDREDSFLNAHGRRRFLRVVDGDLTPTVRSGGAPRRSESANQPDTTCPTCFQVLPRSGVCDFC